MPVAVSDIQYGEKLATPGPEGQTHKSVTIPAGAKFDAKLFTKEEFEALVAAGGALSDKEAKEAASEEEASE